MFIHKKQSRGYFLPYTAFAAAGVGFALPGALMPWLLLHWSLRDTQAGLLLFLFSAGTTVGSLLSRGSMTRSTMRGAASSALGCVLLAFAPRNGALVAMLVFGLGMGMLVTSISLLQARRWPVNCAAELTRLNLLWAVGACAGPWLVLHGGLQNHVAEMRILIFLAIIFSVLGACFFSLQEPAAPQRARSSRFGWTAVPVPLLLMIFCATGVESAAGGWLAAYSQRSGHSLGVTIGAPTCLWAGLLLSRLLHSSSRVGRATQSLLLTWNLLAMSAALVSLILFPGSAAMLFAALVLGFAAGPMYPLLLSLIFRHDQNNMIFVLAGIGAATLPLLTGSLSTAAGSLRVGLVVPAFSAFAMTIAGWSIARRYAPIAGEAPAPSIR